MSALPERLTGVGEGSLICLSKHFERTYVGSVGMTIPELDGALLKHKGVGVVQ